MCKARIKEKLWFSQCGRTDWSAESQVLIPADWAEHLWFDFKCRPWAKNSSPNNNDLYMHYMDKSTGTLPSLEEKMHCTSKLWQQRWKQFMQLNVLFPPLLQQFCSVWNDCTHMFPYVIGDTFLAQGLHLKSHQRCSAGIRTWLSAEQSSSSTLTEL